MMDNFDIDPRLAQIIGMPSALPPMAAGLMPGAQALPVMGAMPGSVPGAMPNQRAGLGASMDSSTMEREVEQFMGSNPQQVAQIQQSIQQLVASGELTAEELTMAGQLATMAMQNPEMYPQIRAFAVQQGIAEPQDLPDQYDPGVAMALVIAVRAVQGQGTGNGVIPSMAAGGPIPETPSGNTLVEAHNGEYMVPAAVVRAKGTEFFDNLVARYTGVPKQ